MNFFNSFVISLGLLLALAALIAAWLFRTATAPLWQKLAIPAILIALACVTPLEVRSMLGRPIPANIADLPDDATLVAFEAHDGESFNTVDLWLEHNGPPPRAYEVPLTPKMKKTLEEAQGQMSQGKMVLLRRRGRDGSAPPSSAMFGVTNIFTEGDPEYEIDPNAFGLPPKGRE